MEEVRNLRTKVRSKEDEAGGLRTQEQKSEGDRKAQDEKREKGAENEKQLTT